MKKANRSLLMVFAMMLAFSGCQASPVEETAAPSSELAEEITSAENSKNQGETELQEETETENNDFMQLQLGSSGFCMTVPVSYTNGEVSVADLEDDQVGYYYTPDSAMDFDIYQLEKNEEFDTLELFVTDRADTFDGKKMTFRTVNGVPVGYYWSEELYQGIKYSIVSCFIEDVDSYIKLVFWLDGEVAIKQTARIIQTLTSDQSDQVSKSYDAVIGTEKTGGIHSDKWESSVIQLSIQFTQEQTTWKILAEDSCNNRNKKEGSGDVKNPGPSSVSTV